MERRDYIKLHLPKWSNLLSTIFSTFSEIYVPKSGDKFLSRVLKVKSKYMKGKVNKDITLLINSDDLTTLLGMVDLTMKHLISKDSFTNEGEWKLFRQADKFVNLYLPIVDGDGLYKMERSPHTVE